LVHQEVFKKGALLKLLVFVQVESKYAFEFVYFELYGARFTAENEVGEGYVVSIFA
jgi:hypothetical protein